MGEIAIQVDGISKRYTIGGHRSKTFMEMLTSFGKNAKPANEKNEFWALDNVSFSVEKGQALGIIGKNGAGKSTLLKILSRITPPTKGTITLEGRVASLLEVGTGFHQELTGRQNIYLNGTILGMKKAEITSKLDEIIAFSGIEKFIDTPVKRYSSGMYVRLAFAVAAHLEPEILVIDEVLAVGDADFQKKCLGKMDEVSKGGRTVLFVSHNMALINQLCKKSILMQSGQIKMYGLTSDVINEYSNTATKSSHYIRDTIPSKAVSLLQVKLLNQKGSIVSMVTSEDQLILSLEALICTPGKNYNFYYELRNGQSEIIFCSSFFDSFVAERKEMVWEKGKYEITTEIPLGWLKDGMYTINIFVQVPNFEELDSLIDFISFEFTNLNNPISLIGEGRNGVILPILHWNRNVLPETN